MEFVEYRQEVERLIERRTGKKSDISLDVIFDAYINDVNPVKFLNDRIFISEKLENKKFDTYYSQVVRDIGRRGYRIKVMPRELAESIETFYNEGCSPHITSNYCVEQLNKNTIKVDGKNKPSEDSVKNRLMVLVHGIDNCALSGVEKTADGLTAVLKIKIFEMRNEISTDIKGYIRELHRYFAPYVRQNVDNDGRIEISGYSVNRRSVYAVVRLRIDKTESEGGFSSTETGALIKMYIEILRTFAEQYQFIAS